MLNKKQKQTRLRIIISGVLYGILLLLWNGTKLLSPLPLPAVAALFAVPYLIIGYDVIFKAFRNIKNGQVFDENFLMMIATFAAFAIGEFSESVAVMLFYQIGELFQGYAVGRSRASIAEMMSIAPEYANLETESGIGQVDPDDVEIGDVIVIRPGEKIPLDGSVSEGESFLNTAALTGESLPVRVSPGDQVYSGSVNGEGTLRVTVEKCYEDSTVTRILELVEEASEKKARLENFITRFAKYYTPAVTVGALLLALLPPIILGGSFGAWIHRACIFLIVSCPCALVISVPLGFFGGIGAASKNGVLVKGGNYLEALARIDTMVMDKTGTLTKGVFEVSQIIPAGQGAGSIVMGKGASLSPEQEQLLSLAACAERHSTHPIACSIQKAYEESGLAGKAPLPPVSDEREIPGRGVIVTMDGKSLAAGNELLMRSEGVDLEPHEDAGTVLYLACDGVFLGTVVIADELKENASDAVREMRRAGIRRLVLLTGDRKEAAEKVAAETGMDEVRFNLLPADKVTAVEELMTDSSGGTAFIGDGINDAPVLMRADVGIAMGSLGSDAAIEAADIVLMDDDLSKIPSTMRIARKTVRIVKENIAFAIGVKVLVLLLGALGFANLWEAVFADVGVAVLAILNAMRMLR